MPDTPIPEGLVALQRAVYQAQAATRNATDDNRQALRDAELRAVLTLHRNPGLPRRVLARAARRRGRTTVR